MIYVEITTNVPICEDEDYKKTYTLRLQKDNTNYILNPKLRSSVQQNTST